MSAPFFLVQKIYDFGIYNDSKHLSRRAAELKAESVAIEETREDASVVVLEYRASKDATRLVVGVIARFGPGGHKVQVSAKNYESLEDLFEDFTEEQLIRFYNDAKVIARQKMDRNTIPKLADVRDAVRAYDPRSKKDKDA